MKKTFEIETSAEVMGRIDRFFALLHHSSSNGHSGVFAMPLDGDADKVTISPKPGYAREVGLCGRVGGDIEIAKNNSYTVNRMTAMEYCWVIKPIAALYKNGVFQKTSSDKP